MQENTIRSTAGKMTIGRDSEIVAIENSGIGRVIQVLQGLLGSRPMIQVQ